MQIWGSDVSKRSRSVEKCTNFLVEFLRRSFNGFERN